MRFGEKEVTIIVVDNGWIVEWRDPTVEKAQSQATGFPTIERKTQGKEIFTSQKKLLDWIKGFV
ncbi:hypothetical protein CL634_07275 [bacterium]|nr:hypothetical protein [bacterium]|tara:strand:+ start:258 stop:449 length:192 start_codon:yes stop_codon:yes gene_type:complete